MPPISAFMNQEFDTKFRFKHLQALAEFYEDPERCESDPTVKEALKLFSFGSNGTHKPQDDLKLRSAVTELLSVLRNRDGQPLLWKIAGGGVLLQEFIMPILRGLHEAVDFPPRRPVRFETVDMGFRRSRLYEAVNAGDAKFVISNGRRIDTELSKNSQKGTTPYRLYRFDPHLGEVTSSSEDTKEGSNAILARVNVGAFDYKLYMRPELFDEYHGQCADWWTKVPLVLARHCPCGLRTLEEIAKAEEANVVHQCQGLSSALAAVRKPGSGFASILPSYLENLDDLKSYDIGSASNRPKNLLGPNELKDHFITILWKPKSMKSSKTRQLSNGDSKQPNEALETHECIKADGPSGAALITILHHVHGRIGKQATAKSGEA